MLSLASLNDCRPGGIQIVDGFKDRTMLFWESDVPKSTIIKRRRAKGVLALSTRWAPVSEHS